MKNEKIVQKIKEAMHYPECWDTMAYPTLLDAVRSMQSWMGCPTCDEEN